MRICIVVVGTGGTGGNLVAQLGRFLVDFSRYDVTVSVAIVDGDTVEMKNISRQPYELEDVGLNKAVALGEKVSQCFGVEIISYPEYITEAYQLENVFDRMHSYGSKFITYGATDIDILVGAVDNHAARNVMSEWFTKRNNIETILYIDSANEQHCGEVVIAKKKSGRIESPDRFWHFKHLSEEIGKPVTEMSCEELNNAFPQHYATNSLAATLIFAYISELLADPLDTEGMQGGILYFDSSKRFSRFDEYVWSEEKGDFCNARYIQNSQIGEKHYGQQI